MKKSNPEAALLRRELDDMLKKWRRSSGVTPRLGWIRNIREGLEMNAGELAVRMGISQNAVSALEKSEAQKSVQLKTLQRAAKALDCQLVYALVPRGTLEKTIEKRRARIAITDLRTLTNGILGDEYRDLIKTYGQTVKRSRLWREEAKPVRIVKAPVEKQEDRRANLSPEQRAEEERIDRMIEEAFPRSPSQTDEI